MDTIEDLRQSLERYADRGERRGAAAILDGTHDRAPSSRARTRRVAVGAAVGFVALVVALVAVRHDGTPQQVTTEPGSTAPATSTLAPEALPSVHVPLGYVRSVAVGLGRVWVVAGDNSTPRSDLYSFDLTTGAIDQHVSLDGLPLQVTLSDHDVWVRTASSDGGPALTTSAAPLAGGPTSGTNALYRIDPSTGAATPALFLDGDGPTTTLATRIAVAGFSEITILDEDGHRIGSATIDDAVGVTNATFPGTNAIIDLAYGPGGLYAVHQGRHELLQLDPQTGRHVATVTLADPHVSEIGQLAIAGNQAWAVLQPHTQQQISALLRVPLPPSANTTAAPAGDIAGQVLDLRALDDQRLIVVHGTPGTVGVVEAGGVRDVDAAPAADVQSAIVMTDGRVWRASWTANANSSVPTTVDFRRLVTDAPTNPSPTTASSSGAAPGTPFGTDQIERTLFTRTSKDGVTVTARAGIVTDLSSCGTGPSCEHPTGHGVDFDYAIGGHKYRVTVLDSGITNGTGPGLQAMTARGQDVEIHPDGTVSPIDAAPAADLIVLHATGPIAQVRLRETLPHPPDYRGPADFDQMSPVDGWVAFPTVDYQRLQPPAEGIDAQGTIVATQPVLYRCC